MGLTAQQTKRCWLLGFSVTQQLNQVSRDEILWVFFFLSHGLVNMGKQVVNQISYAGARTSANSPSLSTRS
ncbi:hypothetical protein P3L10_025777 [Capsicum annuum]